MRSILTSIAMAALCCAAPAQDGDGDGLTDFHERHKYRTDPARADSDGDGVPDGDWHERREHTYTVRSIVRVMQPCGKGDLSGDYQDARILEETPQYVELEVVHYPLCTAGEAIEGSRDWRRHARRMAEYLEPRTNTNWDPKMQSDLLAELRDAGIDVRELTDREVVEQVSRWFVQTYRSLPMFNALHVRYPGGDAIEAIPGREDNIDRGDASWTLEQQFERELLGRSMYYHKTRGTCTSSAMALTTVLRAVGIPTRMVLAIPVVDASDARQVAMAEHGITHHGVRRTVTRALAGLGGAFASHTFNEVFVGGRWHRLNYARLGQPILDRDMFGLVTHVHTFNDLSEWGLQPTWGLWSATQRKTHVFAHNNPYATIGVSDRFGEHADVPNPEVDDGRLTHLTVTRAYWFHSPQRPQWIGEDECAVDGSGHVLMHVDEEFDGVERFMQVYQALDKDFVLRASGHPDVRAEARRGFWASEFYLQIDAAELGKMPEGVEFALHAVNAGGAPLWKVAPGVTIARGKSAPAAAAREHRVLTITRIYWSDSPEAADWIAQALPGEGHLLAHVDEWFEGQGSDQLELFTQRADLDFALEAEGHPTVQARAAVGCLSSADGAFREIYLRVPDADLARMARGVDYRLRPLNGRDDHTWVVKSGLRIRR